MIENFENYNKKTENKQQNIGVEQSFTPKPVVPILSPEEISRLEEKKQLKSVANTVGMSFIVLFVVNLIFSIIATTEAIISGMTGKSSSIFDEPAIMMSYQILFSLISFSVPFIFVFKICGFRISNLISFEKTKKGEALPLFFMGACVCAFANIGTAYLGNFFKQIGIDYSTPDLDLPKGIFGFILSTIAMAVVPALLEEFALRGVVLGAFRRFGDGFAVVASSICFGVMHGNFEQIPFAFIIGLFLGFTVVKTGSLRVAIGVHFYNNFMAVIFSYLPDSMPDMLQNVIYILVMLVISIIGIICFSKTDKNYFEMQNNQTMTDNKTRYMQFFTSVGIIIFLVINILEALSFIFI